MFKIKNKILYGLVVGLLFVSCLPQPMTYKPSKSTLVINDSIAIMISNGKLLFNGKFHYSFSLSINNKSQSIIYIDTLSCRIISIYNDISASSYVRSHISDNTVSPNTDKKVYISFVQKDTVINSDYYLSNRQIMKEKHQFVMGLNLIVGDSIVSKKIIFKPN